MGGGSYALLGDRCRGRYSKGGKGSVGCREETARGVTPLVAEMKRGFARELGIDRIMLYDNEAYFKSGNPAPAHGPEGLFVAAKAM